MILAMSQPATKYKMTFAALRTPEQVLGTSPMLFVVLHTGFNTSANVCFADCLRGLIGALLQSNGQAEALPGGLLALTESCLACWPVMEPAKAALTVKTFLQQAGQLDLCHVAWWDARELVFRDVNSPDGRAFGDLWPEIECYDGVAKQKR